MDFQKNHISSYLHKLREKIILAFQNFEFEKKFHRKKWSYTQGEGGGEIAHLYGDVFEKAAVNFSQIKGSKLPFKDSPTPFFATGVSLITHMMNPHAPTVHMNLRYIETKDGYGFGGGYDLTPMGVQYLEDKIHFHNVAKASLDPFDKNFYPSFSKNASEYFYIPHRKKNRGVGGIFFDQHCSEDIEEDLSMWMSVGNQFLNSIIPIYEKRCATPFTKAEKEKQNTLRAHYVEFNLVYDRGTKFGFESGGNPEAILSSMPPVAHWKSESSF